MFAPVFRTLSTPAVCAIVGQKPRIYSSGQAPQNSPLPYITWFVVADQPYEQISGAPCADNNVVQIDCWAGPSAKDELVAVNLARAVRSALDDSGMSNRVIINRREPETLFFRIGLQVDFIVNR